MDKHSTAMEGIALQTLPDADLEVIAAYTVRVPDCIMYVLTGADLLVCRGADRVHHYPLAQLSFIEREEFDRYTYEGSRRVFKGTLTRYTLHFRNGLSWQVAALPLPEPDQAVAYAAFGRALSDLPCAPRA